MKNNKGHLAVRDLCLVGLMVAVIEACKFAMASLPNIHLTAFWLILFTLSFGKRSLFAVPVFILIEGAVYGFGLWWVMYLYTWPLLVLVTLLLRRIDDALIWSIVSGVFGLSFGFLCSFPYFFVGLTDGGIASGFRTAFAYWISGIPFDLLHCVGNFALMLALYRPMTRIMKKANTRFFTA